MSVLYRQCGDIVRRYNVWGQYHIVRVGDIIWRYTVWGQYHIVSGGYHLALYCLRAVSYRQCRGYHLVLYSLRSVLYRQCGDIIWRYIVWGQYYIVRVGISFGVILSEVSIISSVEGYYLALYCLRTVSHRQSGGYHLALYCLRSVSYRQSGDIIWLYYFLGQFHIVSVGYIIWRYTVWGQYHIVSGGILFGIILSEDSIKSSEWGYHLALYCLRSVSYRQWRDIIWHYTVWGQYHIVRVGISYGVIHSEGSIISSVWVGILMSEVSLIAAVWGYNLALYCLRTVLYPQ